LIGTRNRNAARPDQQGRRRQRRDQRKPRHQQQEITLTEGGVPAAAQGTPTLASPVVFVSAESRARFPWLPTRVIAGSVWRGPAHERVRVDQSGHAEPVAAGARRV
jgi:hypothetical protein